MDSVDHFTALKAQYAKLVHEATYLPRAELASRVRALVPAFVALEAALLGHAVALPSYPGAYGLELIEVKGTEAEIRPMPFKCPRCSRVSHNPNDRAFGWCAACNEFTMSPPPVALTDNHPAPTWLDL